MSRAAVLPTLAASKRWTAEQEAELEQAVSLYEPQQGLKKWDVIYNMLGGYRTAISLELHYQQMVKLGRTVEAEGGGGGGEGEGAHGGGGGGGGGEAARGDKKRKLTPWTEEEDAQLEVALREYVPSKTLRKWTAIATAMGTQRSADAVQARARELSELAGVGGKPVSAPRKKKARVEGAEGGGGGGGGGGEEGEGEGAAAGEEGAVAGPKSKRVAAPPWTAEEDELNESLFSAYDASVPMKQRWEEISKKMNRSVIACEQRHQKRKRIENGKSASSPPKASGAAGEEASGAAAAAGAAGDAPSAAAAGAEGAAASS